MYRKQDRKRQEIKKYKAKAAMSVLLSFLLLFQTNVAFADAEGVYENRFTKENGADVTVSENEVDESQEPEGGTGEEIRGEDHIETTISGQNIPEIQNGAVTVPANPVHNHATQNTKFSYIYFGSYPQSEVRDLALMDAIDKAAAESGSSVDVGVDVLVNGERYRRISKNDTIQNAYFDDVINNGYRYFKYEKIKWKVLKNDGNTLFIAAADALDTKKYNEDGGNATWEISTIRKWLNNEFYYIAFNDSEQNAIVQWNVINEDNENYGTEGGNDTKDNIYFLSIKEAESGEYGFCSYCRDPLDLGSNAYERAIGSGSHAEWWLRSPGKEAYKAAHTVLINFESATGHIRKEGDYVNNFYDISPVLHIDLSSDTWSMADPEEKRDFRNKGVEAPIASIPTHSSVMKNTKLTFSCATSGADIYYTTDGTKPTMASTRYTGEITIDRSMVIRTIGVHRGYEISQEKIWYYQITGDNTALSNPVHHCVKTEQAMDYTDFSYVYFGSYPQSEVTDETVIAAIDKAILTSGAEAEAGKDVWVNGIKYRRISRKDTSGTWFGYKPDHKGYRYFKWERIKWKVLKNDGKTLFLAANMIVDSNSYNEKERLVTWETCTLRKWLNDSFYHTAFNSREQNDIMARTVENVNNPYYGTAGGRDTNDKIYLLSVKEAIDEDYGFCSYNGESMSRSAVTSDYAFARGGGGWWLRSPGSLGNNAMGVYGGKIRFDGNDVQYYNGICPVLHINLSSGCYAMTDDGTSGEAGEERIPLSIRISKEKTVYYAGEALTIDDLKVTAAYQQHPGRELKAGEYTTNIDKINMNAPGKKTLTVSYTSGGVVRTASVIITVKAIKKLSITGPSGKLAAGKKVKLTIKSPKSVPAGAVKWKSSNKKYASVDKNGIVTVKKAGIGRTVTITARPVGSKAESRYRFTIMKHAVKKITLKAPKKTLSAGKSMNVKAAVKTTGKQVNKSLTWKSSDKKYAVVNSKGRVTAKKGGKGKKVTITAASTDGSNKKATIQISIQ